MTNRSEAFGRLLKAGIASIVNCEGKKAPIVEDELGQLIGISGDSIQRYKSGHLLPEDRTVEILATAAVQRGYLSREWLRRFLHAARYPFADKLLDQLCPVGPMRSRPPRIYENLPAPIYSQFVMRAQAFGEVVDGLQQRSATVLIVGLGGNGKTSLAREVAAYCLQDGTAAPRFDAVVWVSDKDRPGTTNLSVVLDEVVRTLDYPGFTQFAHDEKLYEVGQLLKRQHVLVVVDNFETITDGALLSWLLRLPEPSKALITSREYSRAFRSNTSVLDLRGLREHEAQELVNQRLRFLKLGQLVNDHTQLEPLLIATGGNPKAIEVALGLVKYEHRPLQQVVEDLYAARGELFADLFARAWALLDEAARRVLLVMTFFPASASGAAVGASADVQGFAFDRAVEQLTDLALLDMQQEELNSEARYTLHPLVRSFAQVRLAEQPEFEVGARERWLLWYQVLVTTASNNCWYDLKQLEVLDTETETIEAVILWAFDHRCFEEASHLVRDTDYYFLTRGDWARKLRLSKLGAKAAYQRDAEHEEMEHLAHAMQILSKQSNFDEIAAILDRLNELSLSTKINSSTYIEYHHARALYAFYSGNISAAQKIWEEEILPITTISLRRSIGSRRWIAECLHLQGRLTVARDLLKTLLHEAVNAGFKGGQVFITLKLIDIELHIGNLDDAAVLLHESRQRIAQNRERRHLADIHVLAAHLHTLRGDRPAARAALTEAIDLFERLGMRRELAQARAELARLDEPIAVTG